MGAAPSTAEHRFFVRWQFVDARSAHNAVRALSLCEGGDCLDALNSAGWAGFLLDAAAPAAEGTFAALKPPRAPDARLHIASATTYVTGSTGPPPKDADLRLVVCLEARRPDGPAPGLHFSFHGHNGGVGKLPPGAAVLFPPCASMAIAHSTRVVDVGLVWARDGPGVVVGGGGGGEPEWCGPLPPRLRLEAAAWLDEFTLANLCEVSRGCYAAFGGVEALWAGRPFRMRRETQRLGWAVAAMMPGIEM